MLVPAVKGLSGGSVGEYRRLNDQRFVFARQKEHQRSRRNPGRILTGISHRKFPIVRQQIEAALMMYDEAWNKSDAAAFAARLLLAAGCGSATNNRSMVTVQLSAG